MNAGWWRLTTAGGWALTGFCGGRVAAAGSDARLIDELALLLVLAGALLLQRAAAALPVQVRPPALVVAMIVTFTAMLAMVDPGQHMGNPASTHSMSGMDMHMTPEQMAAMPVSDGES